jgi:hypothetical protein
VSAVLERQGHTTDHRIRRRFARTAVRRLPHIATSPAALLAVATAIASAVLFWLAHRALIDDAYITLTYARTLAEHGQWGMLPDHQANSATSPVNVLLLGGLSAVVGDPRLAAGVLYVATCVALVLGLRGVGRTMGLGDRVALIGGPLLIASPLLASTIGMETMLVVTAMTYLMWACVRGDAVMAGLAGGVLVWLRLDTVVIAAVLILATPALWRRLHLVVSVAAAVVTPWLVFSWIALGSAVPDTLVIKQGSRGWGSFTTSLVQRYYPPFPWAILGVLVLAGAGLVSVLTWAWWRSRARSVPPTVPALAVAGAAYFGLMWTFDVPPFFWYYGPTLAALILAAAIGLATLTGPACGRLIRSVAATLGAGLIVLTLVPWAQGASTQVPMRAMPVHGNWALPGEYEEIGRELGQIVGDSPVRSPGEVGGLAYFCECTIVDRFSDRATLSDLIKDARHDSWLYRLNYLDLDVPQLRPLKPGYWLVWRPGPDPTDRGWNTTGMGNGRRAHGHLELLNVPPRLADRALSIGPHDGPWKGR